VGFVFARGLPRREKNKLGKNRRGKEDRAGFRRGKRTKSSATQQLGSPIKRRKKKSRTWREMGKESRKGPVTTPEQRYL